MILARYPDIGIIVINCINMIESKRGYILNKRVIMKNVPKVDNRILINAAIDNLTILKNIDDTRKIKRLALRYYFSKHPEKKTKIIYPSLLKNALVLYLHFVECREYEDDFARQTREAFARMTNAERRQYKNFGDNFYGETDYK